MHAEPGELRPEAEAAGAVPAAGGAELRLPAPAHAGQPGAGRPPHPQYRPEDLRNAEETHISIRWYCTGMYTLASFFRV